MTHAVPPNAVYATIGAGRCRCCGRPLRPNQIACAKLKRMRCTQLSRLRLKLVAGPAHLERSP